MERVIENVQPVRIRTRPAPKPEVKSYLTPTGYGKPGEVEVSDADLIRLAEAICAEMGGTMYVREGSRRAGFVLDGNLITLWTGYNTRPKVQATISIHGVSSDDASEACLPRGESAAFHPDRPVKTIAADIRRRVIDASKDALDQGRARILAVQERRRETSRIEAEMADLGLDIRRPEGATSFSFWSPSEDKAGIRGDVRYGSLYIERSAAVSVDQLRRILAVLREP